MTYLLNDIYELLINNICKHILFLPWKMYLIFFYDYIWHF